MRINLELMAMLWLRSERKCEIVLRERTPRWGCGQPDVLGVTKSRYLIEIEIKRSISDFRADAEKVSRINRFHNLERQPRQFYYLAEKSVADKILPEVPVWAGLMHVNPEEIMYPFVQKLAPINEASKKLTIKEYLSMVRMLTNHVLASESSRDAEKSWFRYNHQPYLHPGSDYYDI